VVDLSKCSFFESILGGNPISHKFSVLEKNYFQF
jgi:hypothetical protein